MSRTLSLLAFFLTLALAPMARAGTHRGELSGVVNLNTANEGELTMLPGIGPKKAARIIEARQKRKFDTPEQIRRVKGFGLKTYRKLKPYLAVNGSTTIAVSDKPAEKKDDAKDVAPDATVKPQKGHKKAENSRHELKPDDEDEEPAPT